MRLWVDEVAMSGIYLSVVLVVVAAALAIRLAFASRHED
jgi:hypothetical protein